MKKAKDLRDLSLEELEVACSDARKDLFDLINKLAEEKKLEKPHLIPQKRKEIARLLTVIREKRLAIK